jgi:hypothetical protein
VGLLCAGRMIDGSQMKSPGQWDRAGAPKTLASVMGLGQETHSRRQFKRRHRRESITASRSSYPILKGSRYPG